MTVLAFDCAVSGLGVAVVRDGVRLASLSEGGRDQAARLLPAIEAVLADAGVDRRALTLIAVTIGPGSFTGVRVGLAAARGLAVGLGVPLAGITTTAVLLAQAADRATGWSIAAIDSRLGDWFCAVGEGDAAPFVDVGARSCGPHCRPAVPRRRHRRQGTRGRSSGRRNRHDRRGSSPRSRHARPPGRRRGRRCLAYPQC